MNDMIFELIGKLLAAFVVGVLAYLAPRIKDWLATHINKTLVYSFARAAEHLLKADDPTGEKRHAYVEEHLQALGVAITESTLAMIEGEVWEINKSNKAGDGNDGNSAQTEGC